MRGGHIDEAFDFGCKGGSQQPRRSKTVHLERSHGICNAVLRVHSRKMYHRVHALAYLTQRLGRLPGCFNYTSRWQPIGWRGGLPRSQNRLADSGASQVLRKASADVAETTGNKDSFQTDIRAPDALLVLHLPVIGEAAIGRCPALYLAVVVRQRCAIREYGRLVPDTLKTVPQKRRDRHQTVVFG